MSSKRNNSRKNFSQASQLNIPLVGIEAFIKSIEKDFFSNVTVRVFSASSTEVKLVVELDSNLELVETLNHFNKNLWGNFLSEDQSFVGALHELQDNNDINIEVEEFSIYMKDTSLIINQIYEQSIPEHLENIFKEISKHYIHFTKGLAEIPYEIYVPVFEDRVFEKDNAILAELEAKNTYTQNYFSYWGVYFNSEDDAVVYDLNNQIIIEGHLQMLNR